MIESPAIGRPDPSEYQDYFSGYISLVLEDNIIDCLERQLVDLHEVLDGVSVADSQVLHAPYTWTLNQVMGHCIDTERIFGYRIGCLAAGDATPLPGFDQDAYVANMPYQHVLLPDLVLEFDSMRRSHLLMMKRFSSENWTRVGVSSGGPLSVRSGAYILAGHLRHHLNIMKTRLAS